MRRKYFILIIGWLSLFCCSFYNPASAQSLDDVLKLIKSVEEKIQELDTQQKQDVHIQIAQLEQEIEKLKSENQTNTTVIKDFSSEISKLMAELRVSINGTSKPEPAAQTVQTKAAPENKKSNDDFRVYWKNGIRMETADNAFQFTIGARIMNDWTFMSGEDKLTDALGKFEDGTEIRRAWIQFSGLIYNNVEFNAFYGLDSGADILDLYMALRKVPLVGNVRIGHFKEPIGLEQLMSSNDLSFIERSLAHALNPFRNTGLMLSNTGVNKRITWAAGVFRDTDDYGNNVSDGKYNYTARLTGLPLYSEDGKRLIHIGAAYSRRNPVNDQVRFRSRPETHLGPQFVDTKNLSADNVDLINAELGCVYGRGSIQGEFMHSGVGMTTDKNANFASYYVMGSFLITNNYRTYKQAGGAFGGIMMDKSSYYGNGGCGAWEATLRYSGIDLSDAQITGGELRDITVGLNWYLNSNTRVMWDYIRADLKDVGYANSFLMRFQFNI